MSTGQPFSYYDLGQRKRGDQVEVSLSTGANVFLVNSSNYSAFKAGRRFTYHGGLAKRTPFVLTVPASGHWYIVIHLWGLRARSVKHSIREVPKALPEMALTSQPDLSSIVREVVEPDLDQQLPQAATEYDVLISHASEDKPGIVRGLVSELQKQGVKVWYDEFELVVGSSLRRSIDEGLTRSRFGLVVLSHAFFAKGWPQRELDGIVALEVAGRQRILPVWHEISKDEVLGYSPTLADRVALSTSVYTALEIATEIAGVIHGRTDESD